MAPREFIRRAAKNSLKFFNFINGRSESRGNSYLKKRGVLFTPQAFAVIAIAFLAVTLILIQRFFVPAEPKSAERFHIILFIIATVVGFGIFDFFFPGKKSCDLYYFSQKSKDRDDYWRGSEASCHNPAIGKVRLLNWGKRHRYFCSYHNPTSRFMQEWLRDKNVKIDSDTIKKLRFAKEY